MLEPIFSAPVSVEQIFVNSVAPSLLSVAPFRPIIRGTGDTRHLLVIDTFARECCPSQMILDSVDGYAVIFYGHDRYRMAVLFFRYLVSAGLARVAWRIPSARPFHSVLVARDGANIAAFIGKTYVFIGS